MGTAWGRHEKLKICLAAVNVTGHNDGPNCNEREIHTVPTASTDASHGSVLWQDRKTLNNQVRVLTGHAGAHIARGARFICLLGRLG